MTPAHAILARRAHQDRRRAFTLVELLVVIAIIGILSALILPAIIGAPRTASAVVTQSQLKQLAPVMEEYRRQDPQGHYPADDASTGSTAQLVQALYAAGLYNFSDDDLINDPPELADGWKQPWDYRAWLGKPASQKSGAHNPRRYDLQSAGPDGDLSTAEDNVTNWSTTLSGP